MAFIRVKTIKGNEYAYLVENHWNGKSSRQRVSAYLGRVISYPNYKSAPAPNINGSFQDAVNEMIAWQLTRMGFSRKNNHLLAGKITFDLTKHQFTKKDKPLRLVIKNRDGFLCERTIQELTGFVPSGEDHIVGLELAKTVVTCGLDLSKELFVALFEKATQMRKRSSKIADEIKAVNKSKPF